MTRLHALAAPVPATAPARSWAGRARRCGLVVLASAALLGSQAARAGDDGAEAPFRPDEALLKQVTELARGGASQLASPDTVDASGRDLPPGAAPTPPGAAPVPAGVRIEVEVGRLDPRLRLAPCARIQPYLPAGTPLWGASRVGLKCVQGPRAWNVSLPVTVHVWGRATIVTTNLAAGTVLEAGMLGVADVDLAAAPGAAVSRPEAVVGRTLSRPINVGSALRQTDLKARQWFAAGETVRVVAVGPGWQVVTEAQAVSAGIEGQIVRVRTDTGRLLVARPTGEHQVELTL